MDEVILAIDDLIRADVELLKDAEELWALSKSSTNEYNKTVNISKENVNKMREKSLDFVLDVLARVSLPGKIIENLRDEIKDGMSAIELLQSTKKYCNGDDNANKLIDSACNFIKNISNHYPIIGNGINLSDPIVERYRITITTVPSEESIGS